MKCLQLLLLLSDSMSKRTAIGFDISDFNEIHYKHWPLEVFPKTWNFRPMFLFGPEIWRKKEKIWTTLQINTYLTSNNFLNIQGRSLVIIAYQRQRYFLNNDIYKVLYIKSAKVKVGDIKIQTIISQKPVFLKFLKNYILLT